MRAFRPGTVANQDSHALLFIAFTIHFGFTDVPAQEDTLLCFAEFLLRTYTATKSVTNALSAVKRLHLDCGAEVAVFSAPGVERWKRALPLTVRSVPRPAPPLPLAILEELCAMNGWGGGRGQHGGGFVFVAFLLYGPGIFPVATVGSRFRCF